MHRRDWLILAIAVPLVLVVAVMGLALTREAAVEPAPPLTAEDARILRLTHSLLDDPTDFDSRLRLGWAYQQQERYQEALEQYDIILKRRPRSLATWYYKGLIYRDMGLDLPARDAFTAVLDISEDHVLAAIALGQYHLDRGEYRELLRVVGPAAAKHPEAAEVQYLMGRGHEALGEAGRARERYRQAVKYAPDLAKARKRLRELDKRTGTADYPPRTP